MGGVGGTRFDWPTSKEALERAQTSLASATPHAWSPGAMPIRAGGVALVSTRGVRGRGRAGETAFAAAVLIEVGAGVPRELAAATVEGPAAAPFETGLLALREGPLLERAVRALPVRPDVLLVHAAGRDHPRGAGLALMLGAALELPTVGVTSRPLLAVGDMPGDPAGSLAPLRLGTEVVGYLVRTCEGVRPVAAHAGWRTSPEVAAEVVLKASGGVRMPEPIRRSLEIARGRRSATATARRAPR